MKRNKKMICFTAMVLVMFSICFGCSGKKEEIKSSDGSEKEFVLTVIDSEGAQTEHQVVTTKETVGEALLEKGLIEGDDGPYGIYVKTVTGKTLDYDKDGKYWAFYIDDEYASSGVDKTEIVEGVSYAFKAEK